MTARTEARAEPKMCSLVSRAGGEDAIASAGPWERCLLIEVQTPWAQDILGSRHFPKEVLAALQGAEQRGMPVRVQGLVPDPDYSSEGHTRVIDLRRPEGPFAYFDRDEYVVADDEIGVFVESLLNGLDDLQQFSRYRRDVSGVRDLLVCTHGSRDPCCARFGAAIYQTLREANPSGRDGSLRVWRTSHTGGHRFAATMIDLPEGRFWGWLDEAKAESVLSRSGPVAGLRQYYRGWAGLDSPFAQVAEREALVRKGWAWTGYSKQGRVLSTSEDGNRAEVRLEFTAPGGSTVGAYEATVELVGSVSYTVCLPTSNPGEAQQYKVTRFDRVDG